MADFSSSPVPFPEVFREDLINPGAAISRSIQPTGINPRDRPGDKAGKHLAGILRLPSHRSTAEQRSYSLIALRQLEAVLSAPMRYGEEIYAIPTLYLCGESLV